MLGLDTDCILPGYEDVWYYLWRERQLPVNVDPFDSRLDDELERERLRRVFKHGLDNAVGYTLPIARDGARWRTGRWFLRDERLYLLPGDSPMGFRLPMDAAVGGQGRLPVSDRNRPRLPSATRCLAPPSCAGSFRLPCTAPAAPPPTAKAWRPAAPAIWATRRRAAPPTTPAKRRRALPPPTRWCARTALCVEARLGVLYVFMPPLAQVEDYLALLKAAVETTAESPKVKLVLKATRRRRTHG
ncbi:MAG: transglutaminase family protein [Rivihabitans pingtungensis]